MTSLLSLCAALFSAQASEIDQTISRVEQMVYDQGLRSMVERQGLNLVNVMWEDTGRSKGSSVGPNISDMTIGVRDSNGQLHPMPVFRFDNFSDKTADVRTDKLKVMVGNHKRGGQLRPVSLTEVLRSPTAFLSNPNSWKGSSRSLWNSRDTHVLVSAQAAFLPVPRSGEATFTPVLYNYQSYSNNPAVLTMVATREGTSIQVIENEGGYMSEPLFFNHEGERAPFTAMRLSDVGGGSSGHGGTDAPAGVDVVLVVQVPLKQKPVARYPSYGGAVPMPSAAAPMAEAARDSDVEAAVIGHGETEGPMKEIDNLAIERDPRFPVRVTVQFYKATSTGKVSEADVAAIRKQIDRVYDQGDWVGSLVTEGWTSRPTETGAPATSSMWAPEAWSWLVSD
jgi:hypothetical protein